MPLKLFTGTANIKLSKRISSVLKKPLSKNTIRTFNDHETYVRLDESVRGASVFIVQPTSYPANENLMQLCLLADACKRASAKKITAVIPYFGYSRSDRRNNNQRESISAKLAANLITASGIDRVIVSDIHSPQTLGYFDIPVIHVKCMILFSNYIRNNYNIQDIVVVSPDIGGVIRSRNLASYLDNCPIAIIDKRRTNSNVECINIVGDVKNKIAIIIDDIIDTGSTISKAADLLKANGATNIIVCATHAVLSKNCKKNIENLNISKFIFTDTIEIEPFIECNFNSKLKILSTDKLIGHTIQNVYSDIPLEQI